MKKITKILIAALALGLFAMPVFAEDDDYDPPAVEQNNSAAGIYVMGLNSYSNTIQNIGGLQFQHWFNNLGVQVTLGGYAREETYYDIDDEGNSKNKKYLDSYFSVGANLMYSVFSTNQAKPFYSRFYIWVMGGAVGGSNYDTSFFVDGCAGIGLGAELVMWHRMSIPLEFGFAGNFPKDPGLSFSAATGLRFRF